MTSKNFQIQAIKRNMLKFNVPTDLIDFNAHVDSTLNLEENNRILKEKTKKLSNYREEDTKTKSINKIDRYFEAEKIFNERKEKQRILDHQKRARITYSKEDLNKRNFNRWKRNPNRYDIEDIDTR